MSYNYSGYSTDWVDKVEATGCVERKPSRPQVVPAPTRGLPYGRMGTPVQGTYQVPHGQQVQFLQSSQYVQILDQGANQQQLVVMQQNAPMYVAPQPAQLVFVQTAPLATPDGSPAQMAREMRTIPHSSMYQLDGATDRRFDEEVENKCEITKKGKKIKKTDEDIIRRMMKVIQLDGNGATMSDSSSEDEDFDPLRRLAEKVGKDDEGEEEEMVAEEEPPLNSDDDEYDESLEQVFETENVIICQFEKINRARTKWKLNLKDGVMHINKRDHCFSKATGEATF